MIYRQNFTFYQKKTGFAGFARLSFGYIRVALLAICVGGLASQAYGDEAPLAGLLSVPETEFPDETLQTKHGKGFSVAGHEGPVILNFWATWCAPCVHELPELAEAARALSKDEMPIDVVLISVDRKGADHAQDFLDERGITDVISAYNPTSTWPRALGLRGLPSTYLISADRGEIYLLHGPASWADDTILAEIRAKIGH